MVGYPKDCDGRHCMTDADGLLDLLADKTRRAAVGALLKRPYSSGELAKKLAVSPQALSRHLRKLRQSGLVRIEGDEADARLRIYRVAPARLNPLRDWFEQAGKLWTEQLDAFRAFAEDEGQ